VFRPRRAPSLVVIASLVLLASCGDGEPTVREAPPGRLAGGSGSFQVTGGDLRGSAELALVPTSVYSAPPGGMVLTFADDAGNFLGVGGVTFTGSKKTSVELSVTLTVADDEPALFVSENGECTIDVSRADDAGIEGSIECANLANEEASIDATASFLASA
jgi:hypothetical protein